MRFDDALHVRPDSFEDSPHAIFCAAWQTKVDRRRRGTKYAVPKLGLTELEWVIAGYDLYRGTLPEAHSLGDVWLVARDLDTMDASAPLAYNGFAEILTQLLKQVIAVNPCGIDPFRIVALEAAPPLADALFRPGHGGRLDGACGGFRS